MLRLISTMSSVDPVLAPLLQRLRQLRTALIRLHKALLDSERIVYEQFHGRIQTNGEFFRLVIGHEWFSWLRPISQFIAHLDETLSAKEPVTLDQANQLLDEARSLIQPKSENTLQKRYHHAIQRDPNIALMHAEVANLLVA